MNIYFKVGQDLRKKKEKDNVHISSTVYTEDKIYMTRKGFEGIVKALAQHLEMHVHITDEELPDDLQ